MPTPSVFDQLVRDLNSQERRDLLEKIRAAFSATPKPLLGGRSIPPPGIDVEEELARFSLFKRFVLFIRSLFSSKDRISLVRDMILGDLKRQLSRQAGGLLNFTDSSFTERFCSELTALAEAAAFFQAPLQLALRREKSDFYAYLAGTELRETQRRLEDEIKLFDPSGGRRFDESTPKKEMLGRLDSIIEDIPPESKSRVYRDVQALYSLYGLSGYGFGSLLGAFKVEGQDGERRCDFQPSVAHLPKLANRLAAAKSSPSADALRVLFLFGAKDRLEEKGFDLEQAMTEALSQADAALSVIRRFNDRVPLVLIVRCITRNLDYSPKEMGGAEDWFVVFKEFWRQRIEDSYRGHQRRKRRNTLLRSAREYFGVEKLPAPSDFADPEGEAMIRYAISLAFLQTFYRRSFKKMHKPLEIILTQGQFYKQQNREDFSAAFDALAALETGVLELQTRLGEKGYYGTKIRELQNGGLSAGIKAQQTDEILSEIDADVLAVVDRALEQMQRLTQLLSGILHGEPGAKFDTIANLEILGGGENALISSAWEKTLKSMNRGANLLRDIRDLEKD